MLQVDESHREYVNEVKEFAASIGMSDQLQEKLDYLDTYAEHGEHGRTRCVLYPDFAPYSFNFNMQIRKEDGEYHRWFIGGLIFHGPHDNGGDGGAPTFSVNLTPMHGWSVHT